MMFGLTTKEIMVTEAAKVHLTKAASTLRGLRLMILSGKGCGGNEYDLRPVKLDDDVSTDDALIVSDQLTIFIPKKDVLKLFGCTIDFVEDSVGNRKIEIINPNEKGRCGCGLSVSF
jgi:iron-sulfur cluster assembly accessory protein